MGKRDECDGISDIILKLTEFENKVFMPEGNILPT